MKRLSTARSAGACSGFALVREPPRTLAGGDDNQ
jgi:hypothetical protein